MKNENKIAFWIGLVVAVWIFGWMCLAISHGMTQSEWYLTQVNVNRVIQGLPQLKVNPLLMAAAQKKAEDMAKRDYFSHKTPEGSDPWVFFTGYKFKDAGENLARFWGEYDVMTEWLKSPTHKSNILNKKYAETGIGISKGKCGDNVCTYVVEFFGRR